MAIKCQLNAQQRLNENTLYSHFYLKSLFIVAYFQGHHLNFWVMVFKNMESTQPKNMFWTPSLILATLDHHRAIFCFQNVDFGRSYWHWYLSEPHLTIFRMLIRVILLRGERIVFWWPNTNTNIIRHFKNDRIRIRILFGLKKATEYEYEYYSVWKKQPNTNTNIIRFEKIDRIRIRILFGLKKSTEYEYYSVWKRRPNTNTNIIWFEKNHPNTNTNTNTSIDP